MGQVTEGLKGLDLHLLHLCLTHNMTTSCNYGHTQFWDQGQN